LHLDGKLDASTPEVVDTQVRAAVRALFTASTTLAGTATAPSEPAK
ncbi:TetR family transcriptional regulator, partial [Streptomyces sp. NPDC085995]